MIVPVKGADAKSRLSGVLSPSERRSFSLAMFQGLMRTLSRAGLMGTCFVISSSPDVLKLAEKAGATPVPETSDTGVDSAVLAGVRAAKRSHDFLVCPADLPFLRASDIKELLGLRARGARVIITPSAAFDGTNALLFPRSPRFSLSYDRDSFWNHLATAAALGVPTAVFARAAIMFDVDSPQDLEKLAASGVRNRSALLARGAAP